MLTAQLEEDLENNPSRDAKSMLCNSFSLVFPQHPQQHGVHMFSFVFIITENAKRLSGFDGFLNGILSKTKREMLKRLMASLEPLVGPSPKGLVALIET